MNQRKGTEVAVYDPKYILRLDDLPKCVEADARVWPTFLSLRDCARLFHVEAITIKRWITLYGIPAEKIAGKFYVNVAEFNDWLLAHAVTGETDDEDGEEDAGV